MKYRNAATATAKYTTTATKKTAKSTAASTALPQTNNRSMITSFETPSVFHGGSDDLNHALAHLSWKELAIGFGLVIAIFLVILIIAVVTR